MTSTQLNNFAHVLGLRESGNNYRARTPAFGRYQFIKPRLIDVANALKYPIINFDIFIENFLTDRELQDHFFNKHVEMIRADLSRNSLYNFIGKNITGKNKDRNTTTTITEWGLIAGAHLGGNGGLKNFLVYGEDKKDSLGTYISDYIARFSKAQHDSGPVITSPIYASLLLIPLIFFL